MIDFEQIVDKYSQRLYYAIRRIVRSHDDADDVLQNTFVRVWENLENFRSESALYTWLYRIAVNEALGYLRSQRNHTEVQSLDVTQLNNLYDNDSYFDGDAAQKALGMAIDSLPPKQRAVFNMRYFDEMPYSQIAEITGTSVGGLKASYHHAEKKVEELLNLYIQNVSK